MEADQHCLADAPSVGEDLARTTDAEAIRAGPSVDGMSKTVVLVKDQSDWLCSSGSVGVAHGVPEGDDGVNAGSDDAPTTRLQPEGQRRRETDENCLCNAACVAVCLTHTTDALAIRAELRLWGHWRSIAMFFVEPDSHWLLMSSGEEHVAELVTACSDWTGEGDCDEEQE